jgi:hypothetical protein
MRKAAILSSKASERLAETNKRNRQRRLQARSSAVHAERCVPHVVRMAPGNLPAGDPSRSGDALS